MDEPSNLMLNPVTTSVHKRMTRNGAALRRLCLRLILSVTVFVVFLKFADLLWGAVYHSPERYLTHLIPNFRQRHVSHEFDYEFRTNSLGFRGPEVPFEKPDNVFRIAVLGDSFVAGNGVGETETFPAKLQVFLNAPDATADSVSHPPLTVTAPRPARQFLGSTDQSVSRIEVLNLGLTGISTVRALDLYETTGRRFHPDLVILAYYLGNDLTGVVQEQTRGEFAAWKPKGFLRRCAYAVSPNLYLEWKIRHPGTTVLGQILRDQSATAFPDALYELASAAGYDADLVARRYQAIPATIRKRIESGQLSEHRALLACLDPTAQRQSIFPTAEFLATAWPRTAAHLDLLRSVAERDGAKFVLTIIPTACQIDPAALEFNRQLGYVVDTRWLTEECTTTRALMDWAKSNEVPALDLTKSFRESKAKLYFTEDTHLTPVGQAYLAKLLQDFLTNDVLEHEHK